MTKTTLPDGFRIGHDDSLACPHRDVSCCGDCRADHVEIVDVYGVCYWIPDVGERADLLGQMTRHTIPASIVDASLTRNAKRTNRKGK